MTRVPPSLAIRPASRAALLAFALVLPASLVGCAAPMAMKASDDAASPTKGIAILYEERIVSQSVFRRYELYPDGTLKVGGGAAARDGKTEWSGAIAPADLEAILAAAEASGIASGAPACQPALVDGTETIRTHVEYASPAVAQQFDLEGRCPAILPLRDAFERAARVRFQRQLDALPEAGKQPSRISG